MYPKFHAKTMTNEIVVESASSFEECKQKVEEYQRANDNPIIKIDIEEVVRKHYCTIFCS